VSLLLDTHVVLWWLSADGRLPHELKQRIDDDRDVRVSAATLWEVGIKQSVGKLSAPEPLPETIAQCSFRQLPITFEHAVAAGRLPMLHRDPFDRMLVAQALCEGLTLVTRDAQIHRYDVDLLRV
jgi:PIN domain nuclease of toxin-antitoxin system